MSCLGDCWDVGPPPDNILFLPPPPIPSFLQASLPDLITNGTPCSSPQLCESWLPSNRISADTGDYVELSRKDVETWSMSGIDDTWLLVLVASSIGVLLLGALLAMFLLKCREMNMFGHNDCSTHTREHRPIKTHEPRDCTPVTNLNPNKLIHPSDAVLYHGTTSLTPDNRMVWAALTPRGTQHFISEPYPRDLANFEGDDHYETIENLNIAPVAPVAPVASHPPAYYACNYQKTLKKSTFENNGFVDYDYEDPTPLIESYQLDNMEQHQYASLGNTDMRCTSLGLGGTLRRGVSLRPQVSSPTRIEHPNLPPLNMYPHKGNTCKRNGTMGYRIPDVQYAAQKYGC